MLIKYLNKTFEFIKWVDRNKVDVTINGKKVCSLKDYGLYGAKCRDLETNEIMIIPFSTKKELEEYIMNKENKKPSKDYYYGGKTYTKESLKRKLVKDGVIKIRRETNYYPVDYDLSECAYTNDFEYFLDETKDAGIIESTEYHYRDCDGKYPKPSYIPETSCKECPFKEECKKRN